MLVCGHCRIIQYVIPPLLYLIPLLPPLYLYVWHRTHDDRGEAGKKPMIVKIVVDEKAAHGADLKTDAESLQRAFEATAGGDAR